MSRSFMLRTLPLWACCHGRTTSIWSFTASWVTPPELLDLKRPRNDWWRLLGLTVVGDYSCSSLVGLGDDSKVRIESGSVRRERA